MLNILPPNFVDTVRCNPSFIEQITHDAKKTAYLIIREITFAVVAVFIPSFPHSVA